MDNARVAQRGGLQQDPAASDLLDVMLQREETMREILLETIDDERESGRTVCGPHGRIRGPLARFPSAVELDTRCPLKTSGAWHTHTHSLMRPEKSLPDVANVVFGHLDTSVVVGADRSAALVAAADRNSMVSEFQDAIGLEVGSPGAVVEAIKDRRIRDPPAARRRVRERLEPLFVHVATPFPEIIDRVPTRLAEPAGGCPDIHLHDTASAAQNPVMREHRFQAHIRDEFRDRPRRRSEELRQLSNTRFARVIENVLVSGMTRRIIFGR